MQVSLPGCQLPLPLLTSDAGETWWEWNYGLTEAITLTFSASLCCHPPHPLLTVLSSYNLQITSWWYVSLVCMVMEIQKSLRTEQWFLFSVQWEVFQTKISIGCFWACISLSVFWTRLLSCLSALLHFIFHHRPPLFSLINSFRLIWTVLMPPSFSPACWFIPSFCRNSDLLIILVILPDDVSENRENFISVKKICFNINEWPTDPIGYF